MMTTNPYEIYNDAIGVQAKFLFASNKSKRAAEETLALISYDAMNYRINEGIIKKIRAQGPNTPMLVEFNSLVYTWQQLLVKQFGEPMKQVTQGIFEQHYNRDLSALEFYTNYMIRAGKYLTDQQIEEYTLNASVLNTILSLKDSRKRYRASLNGSTSASEIWKTLVSDCKRFKTIKPHTLPEGSDPLRKVLAKYRKQSYSILIDGRIDNDNARKVTNPVEAFFNDLFAGQTTKPTYNDVFRLYESFLAGYVEVINNETGEVYSPKGMPTISQKTVQNYLSKWRNEIGNETIRGGDKQKHQQKFKPSHKLERPTFAGSLISIDDRQPPFEYEPNKRMWFYLGVDVASGAVVACVYGKAKEGIIIEFYRQMVRFHYHHNKPLPYELEAESNLNSSFKNTFLQDGNMFSSVRIEANNARGKWIEQGFNKVIRYGLEKEAEGWIGRPFARNEANQQSGAKLPIIPYNELIQARLLDIEKHNNQPHDTRPEFSRFEYWMENQHPELTPTNYRGFMRHIGIERISSCNAGIIRLNLDECLLAIDGKISTGENLIALLDLVEGNDVKIYFLDTFEGGIMKALVYANDEYICEAIPQPRYNKAKLEQMPEDMAARALMSAYTNTVTGYMSRRVKQVEKVIVIKTDLAPKPKTTFKMPGVIRYEATEGLPEILPHIDDEDNNTDEEMPRTKKSYLDKF